MNVVFNKLSAVVSLSETKAIGWALHPYLSDYAVIVHVILNSEIIRSVISDQPCDPDFPEIHPGKWFSVSLTEFNFSPVDIAKLTFRVAETEEEIPVEASSLRKRINGSGVITVESLIATSLRREWVNGATYVEAENLRMSDSNIVDLLYLDILGRKADPDGLSNYVFQKQRGILSFKDIRKSLLESDEYKKRKKHINRAPGSIFSQGIVLLAANPTIDPIDEPSVTVRRVVDAPEKLLIDKTTRDVSDLPSYEPFENELPPSVVNPVASPWPMYEETIVTGQSNSNEGDEAESDLLEVSLPLDSVLFGSGWHNVEDAGGRLFRWMETVGLIFNPKPELAMRRVILKLAAVYGSHVPMLAADFDRSSAKVCYETKDVGFFISIDPPSLSKKVSALQIVSSASGCPLREDRGSDDRILSICVVSVHWYYAID